MIVESIETSFSLLLCGCWKKERATTFGGRNNNNLNNREGRNRWRQPRFNIWSHIYISKARERLASLLCFRTAMVGVVVLLIIREDRSRIFGKIHWMYGMVQEQVWNGNNITPKEPYLLLDVVYWKTSWEAQSIQKTNIFNRACWIMICIQLCNFISSLLWTDSWLTKQKIRYCDARCFVRQGTFRANAPTS